MAAEALRLEGSSRRADRRPGARKRPARPSASPRTVPGGLGDGGLPGETIGTGDNRIDLSAQPPIPGNTPRNGRHSRRGLGHSPRLPVRTTANEAPHRNVPCEPRGRTGPEAYEPTPGRQPAAFFRGGLTASPKLRFSREAGPGGSAGRIFRRTVPAQERPGRREPAPFRALPAPRKAAGSAVARPGGPMRGCASSTCCDRVAAPAVISVPAGGPWGERCGRASASKSGGASLR